MPKFVIEREIEGIGAAYAAELQAISAKSNGVLCDLGPAVQWRESYVTGDKIYCVYSAPGDELIREHARRGGFPADSVSRVAAVIDPTTAEGWTLAPTAAGASRPRPLARCDEDVRRRG